MDRPLDLDLGLDLDLDLRLDLDLDRPTAPSNRSEPVSDEMIWLMRRLRFV
jgi:hypothetical protein